MHRPFTCCGPTLWLNCMGSSTYPKLVCPQEKLKPVTGCDGFGSVCSQRPAAATYLERRRSTPKPNKPVPSNVMDIGSGSEGGARSLAEKLPEMLAVNEG